MKTSSLSRPHKSLEKPQVTDLPLEFYKVIVEHMTEGLWVGDKDHLTRYVNPTFEKIFGYTRAEWLGKHSYSYFDEKNMTVVKMENEKRKKGAPSHYEVEVLSKKGKPIPVLMSGAPLPDGGTVGIMTDLRKLRETEEQYHQLVETMNEGVLVLDAKNLAVYTNPAFLEISGFSWSELRKEDISSLFTPESKIFQRRRLHTETFLIAKNGEKIPVLSYVTPFVEGILITISDLREMKQLEKRAKEFQALAEYSIDAMVSLDEHDIIRAWNVGAERMFGWTSHEMVGQPIIKIVPKDKIEAGEIEYLRSELEKKGFARNHETVRVHKNGKTFHVALTYSRIRNEQGVLLGYSAIYRDITIQKQWERELQERFERVQEAYMEMGKLRRYVDYLVDLLDLGTAVADKTNIPNFVANAILMFAKADAVVVRSYDEVQKKLNLIATAGTTEGWRSKPNIAFKGSLAEKVFAMKKPMKILDITQDPFYKTPGLARKNNLRSLLLLPLIIREQKVGTISVYVSSENRLDVLDHEFIPIFAKQAAFILGLPRSASFTGVELFKEGTGE